MAQPVYLAFVWHMHQPYYRNRITGTCSMPWVRLHAAKDYLDMVKQLEGHPSIHQTFNLVPSLLDQLEEYLPPANRSDDFLEVSRVPAEQLSPQQQRFILEWFFLANMERMIKPYPRYHDLLAKRGGHVADEDWSRIQRRFKPQDYLDLQVWFNLTWIDPWLRRGDRALAALEAKGAQFTEAEKRLVLEKHVELLATVVPAYRDAAQRGQIELTTSPYYHPIVPLLCDTRAAHVALPHLQLPENAFRHPEDATWHIQKAFQRHTAAFGAAPKGLWPSEGSVSEDLVRLAIDAGLQWIASDEEILWRTLRSPRSVSMLYRPHALRRKGRELAIIFRDRELSDLIGFVYSQWDPHIAVADFIKRLEGIHQQFQSSQYPALVSIILDGENAWEFYPDDAHEFFMTLYTALAQDGRFRCVSVTEFLQQYPLAHSESLPTLYSGSWIDANFATWIGHPEKNTAWTYLLNAREALTSIGRDDPARREAWESLGAAEGSDWMWWFGDTHFTAHAAEFDRLFRTHLSNAYQAAGLAVPAALQSPIRRQVVASLHTPTGLIHPTIDGRETSYYEWLYAGMFDLKQQYAAIQRGEQRLRRLYYGFDETYVYLRIDYDRRHLASLAPSVLELTMAHDVRIHISEGPGGVRAELLSPYTAALACARSQILEVAIPRNVIDLRAGERLRLSLELLEQGSPVERYPSEGAFDLAVSAHDLDLQAWSV